MKKANPKVKKNLSRKTLKKPLQTNESTNDNKHTTVQVVESLKSLRPEDEVVTYNEIDFELREIVSEDNRVLIGPLRLTRFERARITGARSLQLSLGAPSLIRIPKRCQYQLGVSCLMECIKIYPLTG